MPENLRHFLLNNLGDAVSYTSPRFGPRPSFPERNRREHANHLLNQVQEISESLHENVPVSAPSPQGVYVEFESEPDFELTIKSLDLKSKGIELLSVKEEKDGEATITKATVFVPDDKFSIFVKKLEEYRDEDTSKGNPKNKKLVSSISNIRRALVRSLWTDLPEVYPSPEVKVWWEVWLRESVEAIPKFRTFCQSRSIQVSSRVLHFPDRYVVLAYATADEFSELVDSVDYLAELRLAKETARDFSEIEQVEQVEWTEAMLGLISTPAEDCPRVCILDTGVSNRNPLLAPFLLDSDRHTVVEEWGREGDRGHGTELGGVAVYEDLKDKLLATDNITIPIRLESVKILPPAGNNDPDLYGDITVEAVSRAEIENPNVNRAVCLAVTSTDARDRGAPSSWSASIDKFCSGVDDGQKRLIFISAGNLSLDPVDYPSLNETEQIHDPGQAWNAITIGAFTEKDQITEPSLEGWDVVAPCGDLSPTSTTSLTWSRKWPIKPELVLEGGNMAVDPSGFFSFADSLSILTAYYNPNVRNFTVTRETSSSTALATNYAAKIMNEYPHLWQESVRALLVHSANWTEAMLNRYPTENKTQREGLLRRCGYGVPNLEKALWSAKNELTLIIQDSLKPFERNRMKDMHFHSLPWPKSVLESLGEVQVEMRVTLSYFIQPSPARRGWAHKHRYQSVGLRFGVKASTESNEEFKERLNVALREEEYEGGASGDSSNWYFGEKIRSKGSLHHDRWSGTASELASKELVGVYPIVGWWRERYSEGYTENEIRYSLIISIHAPEVDANLYNAVENLLQSEVEVTA